MSEQKWPEHRLYRVTGPDGVPVVHSWLTLAEHQSRIASLEAELAAAKSDNKMADIACGVARDEIKALTAENARLKGLLGLALVELEAMDYGDEDEECEANLEAFRQALTPAPEQGEVET